MRDDGGTQGSGAPLRLVHSTETTAEVAQLRDKLAWVDGLSQDGFSRIRALTRVAIRSFESPGAREELEEIVSVLQTIERIAGDVENVINVEAESVGCNWKSSQDDSSRRRRRAAAAERAAGERAE